MTLDEILNLDVGDIVKLSKDNPELLRQYTSRLRTASLKRAKNIQAKIGKIPAVRTLLSGRGVFSIRNMTTNDVRSQFIRYRTFLKNPQSTVAGAEEFMESVYAEMGIDPIEDADERDKFFDVWDRLKERYGDIINTAIQSDRIIQLVYDEVTQGPKYKTADDIITDVSTVLDISYKKKEAENNASTGDVFTISGNSKSPFD